MNNEQTLNEQIEEAFQAIEEALSIFPNDPEFPGFAHAQDAAAKAISAIRNLVDSQRELALERLFKLESVSDALRNVGYESANPNVEHTLTDSIYKLGERAGRAEPSYPFGLDAREAIEQAVQEDAVQKLGSPLNDYHLSETMEASLKAAPSKGFTHNILWRALELMQRKIAGMRRHYHVEEQRLLTLNVELQLSRAILFASAKRYVEAHSSMRSRFQDADEAQTYEDAAKSLESILEDLEEEIELV